jgi:fibronectin type 3 domain-containing protein
MNHRSIGVFLGGLILLLSLLTGCKDLFHPEGSEETPVEIPAVPIGLTVTVINQTEIKVTWDPVSGAERYQVRYGTSDADINTDGGETTDTFRNVTGLTSGTEYFVTVRAGNSAGWSANSAPGQIRIAAGQPPAAPTNVSVSGRSGSAVLVTWNPVTDADNYWIYYGTTQETAESRYGGTISSTMFTINDLQPTTSYFVTVKSANSAGMSLASAVVSGSTLEGSETITSYMVMIGELEHGTITADPVNDVTAGTVINLTVTPANGYRLKSGTLQYNDGSDHAITGLSFPTPASDVIVTAVFELLPAGTYAVTIDSLSHGTITANPTSGTAGTEITLTVTPDSGYRLKTGTLKYGTTAINETTKKFTLPASNVIVTAVFEPLPAGTYTVTIGSLSYGTITANPTSGTAGTEITLTVTPDSGYNLKAGTLKYGTTTIDEATRKFALPGANVIVTAEFELIPSMPYTVRIDSLSHGDITANPSSGIAGTEITLTVTPANGYNLKAGSLKYGTTAIDEGTKKFVLPAADVTVTAEFVLALPDAPVISRGTVTGNSIMINWVKVSGAEGYKVYRTDSGTTPIQTINNPNTISFTDTGLTASTEYGYQVSAYNSTGEGEKATLVIKTYHTVSITVGSMADWNLVAETQTVSKDATTSFGVTGTYDSYWWYLDGIASGTTATYNFNSAGKKPGAVYEVSVVVRNSAGEQRSGRCRITIGN